MHEERHRESVSSIDIRISTCPEFRLLQVRRSASGRMRLANGTLAIHSDYDINFLHILNPLHQSAHTAETCLRTREEKLATGLFSHCRDLEQWPERWVCQTALSMPSHPIELG